VLSVLLFSDFMLTAATKVKMIAIANSPHMARDFREIFII